MKIKTKLENKDFTFTYRGKILDDIRINADNSVEILIKGNWIYLPYDTDEIKIGGRSITPYLSSALMDWDCTVPLITYKEDEDLILNLKNNLYNKNHLKKEM